MRHWFYLFLASCLEVCWIYSLKYLDVKRVRGIAWANFFSDATQFATLLPLLGYIAFGLGNIMLFSLAMKQIPAATAFAAWMAMALVGVKLVDTVVFKEAFSFAHLVYVALIVIGIIGLKKTI